MIETEKQCEKQRKLRVLDWGSGNLRGKRGREGVRRRGECEEDERELGSFEKGIA